MSGAVRPDSIAAFLCFFGGFAADEVRAVVAGSGEDRSPHLTTALFLA
jgi:hypothetical protein